MPEQTRRSAHAARLDSALVALAGAVLFLPGLGRLHLFDWDEINFAEAAREMIVTRDYLHVQVDFRPFAEKPPLFMWLQAAMMHVFGVGALAARLPNAITGVVALVALYVLGRQLVDRRFGLLWALAYAGSLLPQLYFRSGIIDPVFNACIFAGVYGLHTYHRRIADASDAPRGWLRFVPVAVAGVWIGLAVLTKGPVGLLLPGLTWAAFYGVTRRHTALPAVAVALLLTIVVAVAAPWYVAAARTAGGGTLHEFFARQVELLRTGVAGHTGPWYFHLVVLGIGCFPSSVFAIAGLARRADDSGAVEDFRRWMVLLLAVVLLVFSAVQTKIIHYSSLAYYPITFLAATALHRAHGRYSRAVVTGIVCVGLVWVLALLAVPMIGLNAARVAPYLHNGMLRAVFDVPVRWSAIDFVPGLALAAVVIGGVTISLGHRVRPAAPEAGPRHGRHLDAPALLLFGGTALVGVTAAALLLPKIEEYTQGAPVAWYESLRGRDVYLLPLGFKSYAHLFYARKTQDTARREACGGTRTMRSTPLNASSPGTEQWLLHGPIDRPAFFVAQIDKAARWRDSPGLREVATRGAFVLLTRDAVASSTPSGAPIARSAIPGRCTGPTG